MLWHASKPLCAALKNGCCGMLRLHMLDEGNIKEKMGYDIIVDRILPRVLKIAT